MDTDTNIKLIPLEIIVKRYVCPYCHRSRSRRRPCEEHMERCWKNPEQHGCKTCVNFVKTPKGINDRCKVGNNIGPGLVTNCKKWKPLPEGG